METIELDGGSFIGADLFGKKLIYRGGIIPNLAGAKVDGSQFSLEDAAANTMLFWAYLDAMKPETARQLLEQVRADFRRHKRTLPTH